jgi:hypothetical protein
MKAKPIKTVPMTAADLMSRAGIPADPTRKSGYKQCDDENLDRLVEYGILAREDAGDGKARYWVPFENSPAELLSIADYDPQAEE